MPKITPLNASAFGVSAQQMAKASPLRQAIKVQHALLADAIDPDTTPAARAQVARAWVELEKEKRVMRGHGVPKPVPAVNDPDRKAKAERTPTAPITPAA